jgi:putative transposase
MEKRHNFRIYPNAAQAVLIEKNLGCCRFVYNHYLAKRIEVYEKERRLMGTNECGRDLTLFKKQEGCEWLAEADANALLVALKELDRAYKAFFRRVKKGGAPGFPGFRSKRGKSSYTSRKQTNRQNIALEESAIKLPKLGRVRCKVSLRPAGRILSATVIRARSGKYFVSVLFTDANPRPLPKTGKSVGLHLGLTRILSTSEGERVENPKYFAKAEKKIARLTRRLSRKSKDGKNREKARIRLARAHEKVANRRNDRLNKLTTRLVREYDAICVRDAKTATVARDKRFAKLVADAGWGGLMQRLRYKCDWYGKELILVDAYFPSARTCHVCGFESAEVGRRNALREWNCPSCGARHDRGVNAARSVLAEGLGIEGTAGRAETRGAKEFPALPERPRRARKTENPRRARGSGNPKPAPHAAGASNPVF